MLRRWKMLVKLVEVIRGPTGLASLNEIFVNSSHIISISEDTEPRPLIKENLGLNNDVRFSSLILSEGYRTRKVTVIGTPSEINSKVKRKQVLRG